MVLLFIHSMADVGIAAKEGPAEGLSNMEVTAISPKSVSSANTATEIWQLEIQEAQLARQLQAEAVSKDAATTKQMQEAALALQIAQDDDEIAQLDEESATPAATSVASSLAATSTTDAQGATSDGSASSVGNSGATTGGVDVTV